MPAKPKIAFWLESDSQHACEIAARAGFEAVIFDMEHGIITDKDADRLIPLCRQLGLQTYCRITEPERAPVQHALDSGANGIILPQIRDAEHARIASGFAKFPPTGTRGVGYSRIMGYAATARNWPAKQNRSTVCYVQIETLGSLAQADEIALLTTVDGLFLGPSDLSMARGRGLNRWTEADLDDLKRVTRAATKAGKLFATVGAERDESRRAGIAAGAAMLTAGDNFTAMGLGFSELMRAAKSR